MFPPLEDLLETLRVVAIPTRTKFRGVEVREAALFEGPEGWTEFSPFPEYDDDEASAWLRAAISYGWEPLPPLLRDSIAVNATVPAVAASEVAQVLARFDRCDAVKVKVAEHGQALSDDLARLEEVRRLAPDALLRVDANGAWSVNAALTALQAFAKFDLQYAEQPCRSIAELAEVRERLADADIAVPIAADESVRKESDPLRVARSGAADVLIVKAQPLGGIHRAREIVLEAGLPVVVSSALDTSVGISMGAHLAATLPNLAGPCGLGTVSLLTGDVTPQSLRPENGHIPVQRVPVVNSGFEIASDWWRERITRCYLNLTRS